MMNKEFFPKRPEASPTVYAYEDTNPQYNGLLKIGYTTVDVMSRVAAQYPTLRPGKPPYRIVLEESAMRRDGSTFTDHEVHHYLKQKGINNPDGEWFRCEVDDVKSAIIAIKTGEENEENRSLDFRMRPEQAEAVEKTEAYFVNFKLENPEKTPHFLWNAKMRFGKTFAVYQLAKKSKWSKVLVLTFKPAVQGAWEEILKSHIDFKGWQLISPNGLTFEEADKSKPYVCFGSFQDYLGKNEAGGIKAKNEWVHTTNWDCVILDEYHYGAWREKAKELFEAEDKNEIEFADGGGLDYFDEEIMPITSNAYLYLSGTPFRAIASGEFIEEQIYNWTYSDEQRAKQDWKGKDNPYTSLPRMVLLTYQLPDAIREIAILGEFNEFDLNGFFSAEGRGKNAKFIFESDVQKWLDLIRGAFTETTIDNLKLGAKKPPLPFSDARLLNILTHTFWFLPSVASCHAMKNLLEQRQNKFFHDYEVIVAAGVGAGIGVEALPPVFKAMDNPLKTKDYLIMWQINHWSNSKAVDRYFYATQFIKSRNIFSGCF